MDFYTLKEKSTPQSLILYPQYENFMYKFITLILFYTYLGNLRKTPYVLNLLVSEPGSDADSVWGSDSYSTRRP